MKKLVVLIVLFIMHFGYGQNVSEKKKTKTTIKSNFSLKAIKVYQESGTYKIKDYYHYLELISASTSSDSLKKEVKLSLFSLFKDSNTYVFDVTSSFDSSVSLLQLITKIENKNYTFTLSKFENSIVGIDFWTTKYTLEINKEDNIISKDIKQQVYFMPKLKKFGKKTKEVWTIWLGNSL